MHPNRINALDLEDSTTLSCDIVVVGSGAGGAPMAWQLARAGWDVILVEEGSEFRAPDFSRRVWDSTRAMYRDAGGTVTLGTPGIPLPLGRTWGGTTTINSGTCLRIPEFMFDKWQNETRFPITYEELLPYYKKAEEVQHVEPVPLEHMAAGNRLFREGANALGFKGRPLDRNTRGCKGTGLCAFGCPTGGKQSMGTTFLPQAEEAGMRGITGARVDDIIIRKGRASGIIAHPLRNRDSYSIDKKIRIKVEAKAVVLSMGSIFTPWFLLRNHLANSSGEVGRNLRIHPAGKLIGVFEDDVDGWTGVPQAYMVDEFIEEGIVYEGAFIPPAALAMALPAMGHDLKNMMNDYNKLAGFGVMISDTSKGTVRTGFGSSPLVTYSLNKKDTELFRKAIAVGIKVYLEAGAKEVITCVFGKERISSQAQADALLTSKMRPADLELIAFHPVGTCRMGTNPYQDVVNPDGETWDIPNLFVADASLFPASPSVNPQLSIMAMALRIADAIDAKKAKILK